MPILVVEDDLAIGELLVGVLEDAGYTVLIAQDGVNALERLRNSWPLPSLIILDLMMPRMNGVQFRQAQLADPQLAHIPVIVLSAVSRLEAQVVGLEAAAVLAKPFDVDELLTTIASMHQDPLLEQAHGV